ncbi:MAG: hypothetical protein Hals2KO_25760 [Halioglobus sp.]
MSKRFSESSLSRQLALVAACLCLVVGLAIVTLGAISSRHMQQELQEQHGEALAELIAHRVSGAMENGDLLSVSATLQRFIAISAAEEVVITDVDGKILGQAGSSTGRHRSEFSAAVRIESLVAGEVRVAMRTDEADAAQNQLILSLLGLAVLLSLAVYGGARHFAQRLGVRLAKLANTINLEDAPPQDKSANELHLLQSRIEALPMDLLRTRSEPAPQDENYRTTSVLYLHLASLSRYVDSLDEHALQRYTHRLHQVIYAAAGFYGGDIHVARQFGLAVYFSGDNKAGSAPFRAASCGWLIAAVCAELEEQMSLSLQLSMAVSRSELGIGDGSDIYPGLYMQHTLDELHGICRSETQGVLLAPALSDDVDIASRLRASPTELQGYGLVEEFAATYSDLLERQLRLIMRRLNDPGSTA